MSALTCPVLALSGSGSGQGGGGGVGGYSVREEVTEGGEKEEWRVVISLFLLLGRQREAERVRQRASVCMCERGRGPH